MKMDLKKTEQNQHLTSDCFDEDGLEMECVEKDEFGLEDLADDLEVQVEEALNAGVEVMKIIRMFSKP